MKRQMKYLEVYIFNDQPTTCPKCGNRTEIIFESNNKIGITQLHKCMTITCNFIFVMEEDIEFKQL